MRAIDQEEAPFNVSEAIEGLSILDDLSLDGLVVGNNRKNPSTYKTPLWSNQEIRHQPTTINGGTPEDDTELWQSLFKEQKNHYESQIEKLTTELQNMKRLLNATEQTTNMGKQFEKDRWQRVNRILDNYFAEYNVRI